MAMLGGIHRSGEPLVGPNSLIGEILIARCGVAADSIEKALG